ncbi:hypothetical protein D3C71_1830200 [compost metagenome]
MGQFLVDCFVMVDLLVHRLDALHQLRGQSAQLFRVQLVEIRDGSHAADFAREGFGRR